MDIHKSIMDIHNWIMDIHNALLAFHIPRSKSQYGDRAVYWPKLVGFVERNCLCYNPIL